MELGFVEYAQAQTEWLFPELPHKGTRPGATTALFSKWFGRWRRANGLSDPDKKQDFHSFRHTFIDGCRDAGLAEVIYDRLTGHAGNTNQQTSRRYGSSDAKLMADSMNKVCHALFPTGQLIEAASRSGRV